MSMTEARRRAADGDEAARAEFHRMRNAQIAEQCRIRAEARANARRMIERARPDNDR